MLTLICPSRHSISYFAPTQSDGINEPLPPPQPAPPPLKPYSHSHTSILRTCDRFPTRPLFLSPICQCIGLSGCPAPRYLLLPVALSPYSDFNRFLRRAILTGSARLRLFQPACLLIRCVSAVLTP
ncbi:hypothetical protein ElyMa_000466200 [Elysia marginata]|uniref:Uncharacterized protein n=1 Tax=Elysia marginata TaxID=1093978 RepID=A0AAV4FR93_9GAST|nr:hypothetical protein ElyMa_000466200 [Elysia marginata]